MKISFPSFLIALLLVVTGAHAQLRVDMKIKRQLYIAYEPLVATVSITNLAGRDITLKDADSQKWFGFVIQSAEGRLVPPRDPDYQLMPLVIPAGATLKRTANLSVLFPIADFGMYKVRASIYFGDMQKYFDSPSLNIQITEGKVIWQQTVGVPAGQEGAGTMRTLSLLTFRLARDNRLYVRVEDKEAGIIYATRQLGPVLSNNPPQAEIDRANCLHILQLVGLKTYLYNKVGLNGESLAETTYNAVTTRPNLRKRDNGDVAVAGGKVDVPADVPVGAPQQRVTKLSDRPPGL